MTPRGEGTGWRAGPPPRKGDGHASLLLRKPWCSLALTSLFSVYLQITFWNSTIWISLYFTGARSVSVLPHLRFLLWDQLQNLLLSTYFSIWKVIVLIVTFLQGIPHICMPSPGPHLNATPILRYLDFHMGDLMLPQSLPVKQPFRCFLSFFRMVSLAPMYL